MLENEFTRIVEEEWDRVPEKYRARMENIALLVEDEPSAHVRELEGLADGETLLGLYQGIPLTERGEGYGMGPTLPDTITLYRIPTLLEADDVAAEAGSDPTPGHVRQVIHDTLWHEIGHYFGWGEEAIAHREAEGTNKYKTE